MPSHGTFGQVFALAEFRALWSAQILSVAGDQLATVALTLLVFHRTHSALLAAVTFVASIVPWFIGGITLSGLADRFPRRVVMITCDLVRAGLVSLMVIPGLSTAALVALLFLVTLTSAPFSSARAALYADVLPGDLFVLGNAVTLTTAQFAQIIGFAAGGLTVELLGVRTSLVIDAITYISSALITRIWVQVRDGAQRIVVPQAKPRSSLLAGVRLVFGDPALRRPMFLGWLVAFVDVYEGIAAPLAKEVRSGEAAVGLILAAGAFGASIGSVAFSRLVPPDQRLRWMNILAIMACATLTLLALGLDLAVVLVVLTLAGIFCSYQVAASAAFVNATPRALRSQAFGIAQGGISLAQGAVMVTAGAFSRYFPPSMVIAASGGIGVLVGLAITRTPSSRGSF